MPVNTTEILQKTDIVELISRFVPLQNKGANYVGICKFHDDHHASLTVSPSKQIFSCFVCGCSGDAIQFLIENGMSFKEATAYLNGNTVELSHKPSWYETSKPVEWKQIIPDREPISFNHYRHGEPTKTWRYTTEEGKTLGYVCRFDTQDGKEIIPYTYKQSTEGRREWRWSGFNSPRPLYNLHYLAKYPDAKCIVVEGEKVAEFIQSYYKPEKLVVTTWVGGSNAVKLTDFSPLLGRDVVLWRDNDDAGTQAMLEVNKQLNGFSNVKWIHIPDDPESFPLKWDGADTIWTHEGLNEFIKVHLGEVPKEVELPVEEVEKPEPKFLGKSLITFRDGVDSWLDSIRDENNKLSLGLPAFDKEMRGKLRGKLGLAIGMGGVKKSLYSQWVSYVNIMAKQRTLYSSMEMPTTELMSRYLDMAIDPLDGYSASYKLEYMATKEHQENHVKEVLRTNVADVFDNYMFMSEQSSMNSDRYQEYIDEVDMFHGKTDILVVDGLSMLDMEGMSEVEAFTKHSKELKELAKRNNLFVLLICHVSKGGKIDDRDLSKLIRSSLKTLDNSDFYMTFSAIIENEEECKNKGHIMLYNKRGTGNKVDIDFELMDKTARFMELENRGSNFL